MIHPLKLRSERAFDKLRKQGKLPKGVPRDPYDLFKDKGWVDWPDFLGYIRRYMKSADMLPFEEAKRVIQPLKIAGQKRFHELSKQKKLPKGIPGNPCKDIQW